MARRKGPGLDLRQVVDAAIAAVEEEGPSGLSITAVARRLGIRPPSMYNHVDGAEGLAEAFLLETHRRMADAVRAGVEGIRDPTEVIVALGHTLRAWATTHPGVYRTMSQLPPANDHPQIGPILVEILDAFRRPLAELGVEGDEAIHAIRALRSAMHGFVLLEATGQFALGVSPADSYTWLVRNLVRGLVRVDAGRAPP